MRISDWSSDVCSSDLELFSEPPINLMPGRIAGNEVSFANFVHFPLNVDLRPVGEGEFRFGVRPSHISLVPSNDDDLELAVTVEVAEISGTETRSEEHTSELQSLMRSSYAVFCLK